MPPTSPAALTRAEQVTLSRGDSGAFVDGCNDYALLLAHTQICFILSKDKYEHYTNQKHRERIDISVDQNSDSD